MAKVYAEVIKDNRVAVSFDYDPDLVEFVKESFSRRTWNKARRAWIITVENEKDYETLVDFAGKEFESVKEYLEKSDALKQASKRAVSTADIPAPEGLTYFPFQKAGIEFIEMTGGRALIADEMGLGKTIQAIGWINLSTAKNRDVFKVLVIAPASVVSVWDREANKWLIDKSKTVQVVKNGKDEINGDFVIVSYDRLIRRIKDIEKIEFTTVIIDEAHYIKNHKAKRTKAVQRVAEKAKYVIALSGTPFLNRPIELYPTLATLQPDKWNFWYYAKRYCDAYQTKYGWDLSGAAHLEELNEKLRSSVMIRREKSDVIKELPDKLRTLIHLADVSVSRDTKKLEKEVLKELKELKKIKNERDKLKKEGDKNAQKVDELSEKFKERYRAVFTKISKLRHELGLAKVDKSAEFIENILEQENKVIVFAHHQDVIDLLAEKLKDHGVVTLTGSTDTNKRGEIVRRFQEDDDVRVIVASIRAASEGITLTASSTVVFVEFDWTPGRMLQAEDRAHRVGQKDNVSVYWLAVQGTIDEMLLSKILEKLTNFEKGVKGEVTEELNLVEIA